MTNDLQTAAEAACTDAWEQYNSAIERFEAGDVRDACGKAWNAHGPLPRRLPSLTVKTLKTPTIYRAGSGAWAQKRLDSK